MATAGQVINRANGDNAWSHSSGDQNWDGDGYIYVCAPAFLVRVHTRYQSFWRSARVRVWGWFYNRVSNSWVQRFAVASGDGVRGDDGETLRCYHNYVDATTSTYRFDDTTASRNYHLWKFRFEHHRGDQDNWDYGVFTGGPGRMTSAGYNAIAQGRLMKSNGRAGSDTFWLNRAQDDAGALSRYNPNNNRGSLIYAAHEPYIIPDWN